MTENQAENGERRQPSEDIVRVARFARMHSAGGGCPPVNEAAERLLTPCPNDSCFDGAYPYWDALDREHECPDCHGTGLAKHVCDDICVSLNGGT